MTPKNVLKALRVPCAGLLATVLSLSAHAQLNRDSSNSTLLAAADKKATTISYTIKESNVIFPEILKGNETESLEYIEKFSSSRKDYLIRMYKKGKTLLPKAAKILKKHNLPEELKVLLTLESAYNANAVSKAGAVGYWQFMDAVAKEYGLKYVPQEKVAVVKPTPAVSKKKGRKNAPVVEAAPVAAAPVAAAPAKPAVKQVDDRTNFNKATVAAARYLRDRRMNLDDNWLLVVASYNCGVGNVWNAMQRSGKTNPSFWDIKKFLPQETQSYVMNFIALNVIFANYDKFAKNNLVFKTETIELPANPEDAATAETRTAKSGEL